MKVDDGVIDASHDWRPIGDPVGLFTGKFSWETPEEKVDMVAVCERIWGHVGGPTSNFTGMIRFDLVPQFVGGPDGESLGILDTRGVYELNAHSPECGPAITSMLAQVPTMCRVCDGVANIIARNMKEAWGDRKISAVVGNSPITQDGAQSFIEALRGHGLNIELMTPDEAMAAEPKFVYRLGDARLGNGVSHFDPRFTEWLHQRPRETVINTILEPKKDISRKNLLLTSADAELRTLFGENRALTDQRDIEWSLESEEGGRSRHRNLVLKPDGGASGHDIYFGGCHSQSDWEAELNTRLDEGGGWSLWEQKWLPCIAIGGKRLVIDLNPAFWVHDGVLYYMYTILRVDLWDRYRVARRINVAQGAGLAPVLI